jgi:reverse gyrase
MSKVMKILRDIFQSNISQYHASTSMKRSKSGDNK